jgi:hypothetical protein
MGRLRPESAWLSLGAAAIIAILANMPAIAGSGRCIVPFTEPKSPPALGAEPSAAPVDQRDAKAKEFEAELKARESAFVLQSVDAVAAQYALTRPISILIERNLFNACAILEYNGKMALLIDYDWLNGYAANNYWIWNGVIAHELGHHVNNHARENPDKWRMEYEADKFAGRILRLLGATEEQAKLFVSKQPAIGTETHPARSVREAAVSDGYKAVSPSSSYYDGRSARNADEAQMKRIRGNLAGDDPAISEWARAKIILDVFRGDELVLKLLREYKIDPTKELDRMALRFLLKKNTITPENELDLFSGSNGTDDNIPDFLKSDKP